MKKLLTVVAVTLMASGAAIAGTLSYGFINDIGGTVDSSLTPTGGDASFVRVSNFGGVSVDLTAVMTDLAGSVVHSNTGNLMPGEFFSWRPRTFEGLPPSGTGMTDNNANVTIFHSGIAGTVGGNVVVFGANGSRLGFLVQEQI